MASKKSNKGTGKARAKTKTKKRSATRARGTQEVVVEETTHVEQPERVVLRREPVTLARVLAEGVVAERVPVTPEVTTTTVRKRRKVA